MIKAPNLPTSSQHTHNLHLELFVSHVGMNLPFEG
jgi:hypothetical protein